MPVQLAALCIVYLLAGLFLFLKYANAGLYSDAAALEYTEWLRVIVPFFLVFLAAGLLTKRPKIRKTALYWVFSQYLLTAYCALTVGTHNSEQAINFGALVPLFFTMMAERHPWQAVLLMFFIGVAQHWILAHDQVRRIFGDSL